MLRAFLLDLVRLWPSRPDVRAVIYPESLTDRVRRGLLDALASAPGVEVEASRDGVQVSAVRNAPQGRLVGADRGGW